MKITISKTLLPQLNPRIEGLKSMQLYGFSGYDQEQAILISPSDDVPINLVMDIARLGATIENYEYWIEIPNANLGDNVPAGVSFETYLDDQEPPVEQTRTWADITELQANFAATATMRYWQPSSDGAFLHNDVELIEEAGFEVFGKPSLSVKLNADYQDTGDPEYAVQETIEYVDANWRFAGYFDFQEAWLRMQELYVAKGLNDAARWAASTTAEKKILVRWNQVGLNRASDLIPGSWSEARGLKELSRAYREFEANADRALAKRFEDWYSYINMVLSGSGRTKFASDWDWILRMEYTQRHLRFYELSTTNALIDWHDMTLTTYVDADFVGITLTAAQIVTNLRKVLADKKYFI